MISQVGDKFENLKYATPLTLFDPDGLAASKSEAFLGCLILYVVGILGYLIAIAHFSRKNLSI